MSKLGKLPLPRYAPQVAPEYELTPAKRKELESLSAEVVGSFHSICALALRIGLRILVIYKTNAGSKSFRDVLAMLDGWKIPHTTAYRWMNAAGQTLMKLQNTMDPNVLNLPEWEPGSQAWKAADTAMSDFAKGKSLRRILLGGENPASDCNRLEELIDRVEDGSPHADEMLHQVEAGKLTLVQAMRAAAGAEATKGKERKDPIYLDIDGVTGQAVGLFPKCLKTLENTFSRWEEIDEPARHAARAAWKALVARLPRDLR